jgi:uncharacterized protein
MPITKIIIDTNLWVSMAMGSRVVSEQILSIISSTNIEIFASTELLDELTETLVKPRLRPYLTNQRTQHLFDLIWLKTHLITVNTSVSVCRDAKDNFILNLAIDANADYIITGDKDLLVLHPFGTIKIITIGDFLQFFSS